MEAPFTLHMLQQHDEVGPPKRWGKKSPPQNQTVTAQKLLENICESGQGTTFNFS